MVPPEEAGTLIGRDRFKPRRPNTVSGLVRLSEKLAPQTVELDAQIFRATKDVDVPTQIKEHAK
jgi:hypothetical protein